LSEKVMFEVGKKLGKQTAHHLVYKCAMQAFEKRHAFKTVLLAHPVLAACITERDLDHWLDPAHYTGCAEQSGHLTSPEGSGL
ncbi:adenylosuccinate lyase, partial [Klebsiella pneumoniae]